MNGYNCELVTEFIKDLNMGWLSGNSIKKAVDAGLITIEPFSEKQINPNSYNYRLSKTIKRIKNAIIDLKKEDNYELIELSEEGTILYPGECYLGATVEKFGSNYFASLVTGRSSVGRKFVTNHVTAGLIDQGFFGNITLEITFQKPTRVYPNICFGQIFWYTVCGEPRLYNGKYQNQVGAKVSRLHMDYCSRNKE